VLSLLGEYEQGVVVVAVADEPVVLEAVPFREAYGRGVAREGIGVQGAVPLQLEEAGQSLGADPTDNDRPTR
jgi:hypothetical protein